VNEYKEKKRYGRGEQRETEKGRRLKGNNELFFCHLLPCNCENIVTLRTNFFACEICGSHGGGD
jgi:hypothetical protein